MRTPRHSHERGPNVLTPQQLRRLKDAVADGVAYSDLARRFGLDKTVIARLVKP